MEKPTSRQPSVRPLAIESDVPQPAHVKQQSLLVLWQHPPSALNPLTQAVLELGIALAVGDVLGDGGTDDLGDRLVVNGRDGL